MQKSIATDIAHFFLYLYFLRSNYHAQRSGCRARAPSTRRDPQGLSLRLLLSAEFAARSAHSDCDYGWRRTAKRLAKCHASDAFTLLSTQHVQSGKEITVCCCNSQFVKPGSAVFGLVRFYSQLTFVVLLNSLFLHSAAKTFATHSRTSFTWHTDNLARLVALFCSHKNK